MDAQSKYGKTALNWASKWGHLEIIRLLLEKGANVNIQHEYNHATALHWASWGGHLEVVRFLIDKGANIEAQTKDDWTALHEASMKGNLEVVKTSFRKRSECQC